MPRTSRRTFASSFSRPAHWLLAFVLGLLTMAPMGAEAQSPAQAQSFLEGRHEQANRILQRPANEQRTIALTDLLESLLDYQWLAEAALGDHWGAHSEEERAEFVSLLRQLVQRSYSANLQRTLNFQVDYTGAARRGSNVLVQTMARSRENRRAPPVSIDYTMRHRDGRWRVVDITTDGQSLVDGYRGQFHRIIERDGWGGLVERMRSRLAR